MSDRVCRCEPMCQVPYGQCHCGCGRETNRAAQTQANLGWKKGEPVRYIRGHANQERRDRHLLTEFDERSRRAVCSRCGPVTVKLNGGSGWKCTGRINTEHRLTDHDFDRRRAWCRGCNEEVLIVPKGAGQRGKMRWRCIRGEQATIDKFRAEGGIEKMAEYNREWQRKNGRAFHLKQKFGLTIEEYDAMVETQGGVCAICSGPPRGPGSDNGLFHIDHCHDTGAIRGLLCGPCNVALGGFNDSEMLLVAALDYLRKARQLDG